MHKLMPLFTVVACLAAANASAATAQSADARTALQSFVAHVEREWPGQAEQQAITVESLNLLADTVRSIASARGQLTPDTLTVLDRLRTETQRFASGKPDNTTQSTQMRHVLTTATDLLARLAASAGTETQSRLAALRRAADGLDARQPLFRQPDVLERYFHQAAELLSDVAAR